MAHVSARADAHPTKIDLRKVSCRSVLSLTLKRNKYGDRQDASPTGCVKIFTHCAWNSRARREVLFNTRRHSSKTNKSVRSNARSAVGPRCAKGNCRLQKAETFGGIMNEHDESEGIAPPVFWGLTPTLSDVRNISSQLRQCLVLPAALSWADFLPHARETESMPPQRRRLPAGLSQIHILRGRWDTFTLPAASMPTVPSSPGTSTISYQYERQ